MDHPEIQREVQKELDEYLRGERLPILEDRGALPYVEAMLREIMRQVKTISYRSTQPAERGLTDTIQQLRLVCAGFTADTSNQCNQQSLGLPRRTLEDTEYHGMLIPKNSLVFSNLW